MRPEDWVRLRGQLAESEQKLSGLKNQKKIIDDKLADLDVKSPINGEIVTWELETRLKGRPVQKGQSLLKVADPKGEWELALHMPEDRMGFIARAENQAADERHEGLPVYYILATDPGKTLKGTVKEIVRSADIREKDEGNVVLIKVKINKDDIHPEDLREGATVTGKVHCGRRSLGYVWFHDLLAFIQAKVFFRFL